MRTCFLQTVYIHLTSAEWWWGRIRGRSEENSDRELHALRHREGMGKSALPPQGVGAPVFLLLEMLRFPPAVCRGRRCARRTPRLRSGQAGDGARPYTSVSRPHGPLFSEEEVCGYEQGEDYGDYAVHGEEGGVEFGEIVGLDEGMFVEQEERDGDDAG